MSIFNPVSPTVFGKQELRLKVLAMLGIPYGEELPDIEAYFTPGCLFYKSDDQVMYTYNGTTWAFAAPATVWGAIGGDIEDQLDLIAALAEKENMDNRGAANGYCPLNISSKVDPVYLPSYVDDILEFDELADFPVTGEAGVLYLAKDTDFLYRWTGTVYVQVGGGDVPLASEIVAGIAELATTAEVTAGTDDERIVTPLKLQEKIDAIAPGVSDWGDIGGTLSDQTDLQTALDAKVDENAAITGATKTKVTYDAKGLVTAGADATTADIADSTNKRYVTDAEKTVLGNTSGTNTGDQVLPVKATAAELNTGTDDAKFATALALKDSKYITQDGAKIYGTASGTDTYTVGFTPAITSYSAGQTFRVKFTNANTTSATLNVDGLGAKNIFKGGSSALSVGDIVANQVHTLVYDGTQFQIQGDGGSGGGSSSGGVGDKIFLSLNFK